MRCNDDCLGHIMLFLPAAEVFRLATVSALFHEPAAVRLRNLGPPQIFALLLAFRKWQRFRRARRRHTFPQRRRGWPEGARAILRF